MPLSALVEGYVVTIKTEGKADSTIRTLEGNLRRFLWYAREHDWPDDAHAIDGWKIREFLAYAGTACNRWGITGNGSESSRNPPTTNGWRYYRTLRQFFNWAMAEGVLEQSPLANTKMKPPKEKPVEPYSPDELRKLIAVCDHDFKDGAKFLGARNKAILLLFIDTGLRLGEMASLRLENVDLERGRIAFVGKGGWPRVAAFNTGARKALWRYLMYRGDSDEPWLWLTEERRRLSRNGLESTFGRLWARAGVKGSIHKLRHTFALHALRGLRDPFLLQLLLGHKSLEMTRRYTQALKIEEALEAHHSASPVDRLGLG